MFLYSFNWIEQMRRKISEVDCNQIYSVVSLSNLDLKKCVNLWNFVWNLVKMTPSSVDLIPYILKYWHPCRLTGSGLVHFITVFTIMNETIKQLNNTEMNLTFLLSCKKWMGFFFCDLHYVIIWQVNLRIWHDRVAVNFIYMFILLKYA